MPLLQTWHHLQCEVMINCALQTQRFSKVRDRGAATRIHIDVHARPNAYYEHLPTEIKVKYLDFESTLLGALYSASAARSIATRHGQVWPEISATQPAHARHSNRQHRIAR